MEQNKHPKYGLSGSLISIQNILFKNRLVTSQNQNQVILSFVLKSITMQSRSPIGDHSFFLNQPSLGVQHLRHGEILYIQKKNYFTFILLFFKKSLDFFQPIIYHELIEDMFIFDYNPLLIYLYSPQKEQISLSALFTIYL